MEKLTVSVDQSACAGSGLCTMAAPSVFDLPADGQTVVTDPHPPIDLFDDLREAAVMCPRQAIQVDVSIVQET